MFKRLNKKDLAFMCVITASFSVFVVIMVRLGYIWGSPTDWGNQHIVFPDYFRKLFYETGDLFPSFAFNIGAGQNIYNFAYYGLYSPIILLSYLLPFVSMKSYLIGASIAGVIVSTLLLYIYFRNTGKRPETSLTAALLFLFSAPVIFHSHQHIMFTSYLPFLIGAFFATDRYIEKKKPALLIVFCVLIILSSFYYSICSFICLACLWVYRYLKRNETFSFKDTAKGLIRYCLYIAVAVMIAAFFLLPTAYALFSGRGEGDTGSSVKLASLIVPRLSTFLYSPHSPGLTSVFLLAMIGNFFSHKRYRYFLSAIFSILLLFPVINYCTNGFLYIDGKTFIPFLPLALIMVTEYLRRLFNSHSLDRRPVFIFAAVLAAGLIIESTLYKVDIRLIIACISDAVIMLGAMLIYTHIPKKRIVSAALVGVSLTVAVTVNLLNTGAYTEVANFYSANPESCENLICDTALSDTNGIYRISENIGSLDSPNHVYCTDHYQSTVYSSTFNSGYRKFYFDTFNNEISFRNASITNSTRNPLFNMYISNRYIITDRKPPAGYIKKSEEGKYGVYTNPNVFPIGYSSDKIMPISQFEDLEYPYSVEALMRYVIVDDDSLPRVDFVPTVRSYELNIETIEPQNELFTSFEQKDGGEMYLKSKRGGKFKMKLRNKAGNLLFVRLTLDPEQSEYIGDRIITIDAVKNKLSGVSARYHNKNNVFDFLISSEKEIDSLNFWLSNGEFNIINTEFWTADYCDFSGISEKLSGFEIDRSMTSGDRIEGNINSAEDGYFNLSVPFDKGFTVKVDGKNTDYEKVDTAFIGFPITKGEHEISITFRSPGLEIGSAVSAAGLAIFILIVIISNKKRSRKIPQPHK